MKRILLSIGGLFLFFSLLVLWSCAPQYSDDTSGHRFRVARLNLEGKIKFKTAHIETLESIDPFVGRYVRFLFNPQKQKNHYKSPSPRLNLFFSQDGVWVPLDDYSAQILSAYSIIEELIKMEKTWDLHFIEKKLDIFFTSENYFSLEDSIQKNQIWIDSSSKQSAEQSFNFGWLAYKRFQGLFNQFVVLKNDTDVLNREDCLLFSFESIVEGLSLFWGWLFSHDEQFWKIAQNSNKDHHLIKAMDLSFLESSFVSQSAQVKKQFENMQSCEDYNFLVQEFGFRISQLLRTIFENSNGFSYEGNGKLNLRSTHLSLMAHFVVELAYLINEKKEVFVSSKDPYLGFEILAQALTDLINKDSWLGQKNRDFVNQVFGLQLKDKMR